MGLYKNIIGAMLLFVVILMSGTYALSAAEDVPLFDSFYHIFLIITTVGGFIDELSTEGKIITMASVFMGMGSVLYMAMLVSRTIIEGQAMEFIKGLKGGITHMKKMKGHIIVCGHGQLGKYVCQTLKQNKQKYLVIEKDQARCTSLLEHGELLVQGDALEPIILKKAQIETAKAIIGTLGSDSDNIYLMMTAGDINPHLVLAAEARDEQAVDRLHKIGAQIVVLPQIVGGKQLANAVLEMEKNKEMSTISK